jgi:hypothetical protein
MLIEGIEIPCERGDNGTYKLRYRRGGQSVYLGTFRDPLKMSAAYAKHMCDKYQEKSDKWFEVADMYDCLIEDQEIENKERDEALDLKETREKAYAGEWNEM